MDDNARKERGNMTDHEKTLTERRDTIPESFRCVKCDGYGGGNTTDIDSCEIVGKWLCIDCGGSGIERSDK